jgi:peroxiredoxin
MTLDRVSGEAGIADPEDLDWRIRLLAIRDLVRAGEGGVPVLVSGLADAAPHVRQICAATLGVLRVSTAAPDLERVARNDQVAMVRSQAVMSLGQMQSAASLPALRGLLTDDPSRDVRHQCELAIDQIAKEAGATPELRAAFSALDESGFRSVRVGEPAPDFRLPDTEEAFWRLSDSKGQSWVVLIWIFADWCPVCHGEFREIMEMQEEFAAAKTQIFTLECHDHYRGRVMVGKELAPAYWFAKEPFMEVYAKRIWWPHLLDRAGAVAATYGADPMAFAVHAEYINRPATIIIDPDGVVRFAYFGTFWGDRPSIRQTLDMVKEQRFDFVHPQRLRPGDGR